VTSAALAPIGAGHWTADQLAFQAWSALPASARRPKSQQGLAVQLGVDETTLGRWKRLPGWHEAVYKLALDHLRLELVAVLEAQVRQARKGSLPHAQWLFQLAGVWEPGPSRHEHGGPGMAPLRVLIETVDDRAPG
jgi:hypothetical protein